MTEPTMEALDAAVQEAKHRVLHEWGPDPLKYTDDYLKMSLDLDALIAAAEARGAAKAMARECVWKLGEDADGDPCFVTSCGDHLFSDFAWLTFCHHCGGRVRVEEVGDD